MYEGGIYGALALGGLTPFSERSDGPNGVGCWFRFVFFS